MQKLSTLVASLVLLTASAAHAEEAGAPERAPSPVKHRWGLETELVQPFIPEVHIFTLKATHTLWGKDGGPRGDAVLGVYLRPNVAHNVVETIDEYTGIAGYRQYVWKGLHAELLTYVGWARGTRNKLDGKDYEDLAWLGEVSLGYRFDVIDNRAWSLYVLPQGGYLRGLYTNIGPRETPDEFVTAKLLVGARF